MFPECPPTLRPKTKTKAPLFFFSFRGVGKAIPTRAHSGDVT